MRDGIAHLQRAVSLDPTLYETRFELASAFERMGAHEEATRALLAMITPTARPLLSIADPAAGLALLEQRSPGSGAPTRRWSSSELRALAGELDDGPARLAPRAPACPRSRRSTACSIDRRW